MMRGKSICKVLKTIRKQVADANDIKYEPRECHHQGDCRGTCPACEAEVKYIEQQLDLRRQLGKAVAVVGISAGLAALTSCKGKNAAVVNEEDSSLTVGKATIVPSEHLMNPQFPPWRSLFPSRASTTKMSQNLSLVPSTSVSFLLISIR